MSLPTLFLSQIPTCSLEHGAGDGLDAVADRAHCYGVVPPWLEVVHRELRLLHRDAGAVSVECLQLMVLNLKRRVLRVI